MKIIGFVNSIDHLAPRGSHTDGLTVVRLEGMSLYSTDAGMWADVVVGQQVAIDVSFRAKPGEDGKKTPQFWVNGFYTGGG